MAAVGLYVTTGVAMDGSARQTSPTSGTLGELLHSKWQSLYFLKALIAFKEALLKFLFRLKWAFSHSFVNVGSISKLVLFTNSCELIVSTIGITNRTH